MVQVHHWQRNEQLLLSGCNSYAKKFDGVYELDREHASNGKCRYSQRDGSGYLIFGKDGRWLVTEIQHVLKNKGLGYIKSVVDDDCTLDHPTKVKNWEVYYGKQKGWQVKTNINVRIFQLASEQVEQAMPVHQQRPVSRPAPRRTQRG